MSLTTAKCSYNPAADFKQHYNKNVLMQKCAYAHLLAVYFQLLREGERKITYN